MTCLELRGHEFVIGIRDTPLHSNFGKYAFLPQFQDGNSKTLKFGVPSYRRRKTMKTGQYLMVSTPNTKNSNMQGRSQLQHPVRTLMQAVVKVYN